MDQDSPGPEVLKLLVLGTSGLRINVPLARVVMALVVLVADGGVETSEQQWRAALQTVERVGRCAPSPDPPTPVSFRLFTCAYTRMCARLS